MLEVKINESDNTARIIVVGVGGAGNNAVNRTIDGNTAEVEPIGVNASRRAPQFCKAPTAMQTGKKPIKGLGAGARSDVGEEVAEESSEEISQTLKGIDMVFVACSMGGSTGAGAASIVAKIAKDMGILTVGMATKPFRFRAKIRMSNTLEGTENLKNSVDTLVVISNDRLSEIVDKRTTTPDALKKADEVLQQAVQDITGLINISSLINLDFANVQTVMIDKGIAHTGIGETKDDDRAIEVVKQAVSSPLLEATIEGASYVTTNISGDVNLVETSEAASYVQELVGDKANIIFGAMYNEGAQDEASIAVTTTDLDEYDTNAPVSNTMKESTSNPGVKPSVAAAAVQTPHAAVPEMAATASSSHGRQNQGYAPSLNSSSSGNQSYNPPKYNPNQGYNTGSIQNPAPAPSQSFRPAANKEMQISIPDFLKSKR